MVPHFNNSLIDKLNSFLVLDTSVLAFCMESEENFKFIDHITPNATLMIDPVAKLEFLRGAYQESVLKQRKTLLEYKRFNKMMDHYQIHHQTYDQAELISRIYTHHGISDVPLGDLLIMGRLSIYTARMMFATFDKNDFSKYIFDRVGIVTIETETKNNKDIFRVLQFLELNRSKLDDCISRLPN